MIQFDNNNKFDRQHPLGAQKNLIEMASEMKKKMKGLCQICDYGKLCDWRIYSIMIIDAVKKSYSGCDIQVKINIVLPFFATSDADAKLVANAYL